MTIHLVVASYPEGNGTSIFGAFLYKSDAKREVKRLKGEDNYAHQYTEVVSIPVDRRGLEVHL